MRFVGERSGKHLKHDHFGLFIQTQIEQKALAKGEWILGRPAPVFEAGCAIRRNHSNYALQSRELSISDCSCGAIAGTTGRLLPSLCRSE